MKDVNLPVDKIGGLLEFILHSAIKILKLTTYCIRSFGAVMIMIIW